MKYYIPIKPYKWGFKIHMLFDTDSKSFASLLKETYFMSSIFSLKLKPNDFILLNDTQSKLRIS